MHRTKRYNPKKLKELREKIEGASLRNWDDLMNQYDKDLREFFNTSPLHWINREIAEYHKLYARVSSDLKNFVTYLLRNKYTIDSVGVNLIIANKVVGNYIIEITTKDRGYIQILVNKINPKWDGLYFLVIHEKYLRLYYPIIDVFEEIAKYGKPRLTYYPTGLSQREQYALLRSYIPEYLLDELSLADIAFYTTFKNMGFSFSPKTPTDITIYGNRLRIDYPMNDSLVGMFLRNYEGEAQFESAFYSSLDPDVIRELIYRITKVYLANVHIFWGM